MKSKQLLGAEVECPSLPSSTAALDLLSGKPGGLLGVVGSTLARACLVGVGMWVAGARKDVVRNALAGALSIEVFVLTWIAIHRKS